MRIRVHELARELQLTSKEVLATASQHGILLKSASSVIEEPDANRIRRAVGDPSSRLTTEVRPTTGGWRAQPIKPPRDQAVVNSVKRMCAAFPAMQEHRDLLEQLGSQIVYADYCHERQFSECAVALVRFSGAIESAFGLTREVMFFYSPHPDTQMRTYEAAWRSLAQIKRDITPDLLFYSSRDPRLGQKLSDWRVGSHRAIPLAGLDDDPLSLLRLLRDYIFELDLFYETTPVTGDKFFGRRTLLQGLGDDVRHQRVAGLYGLRKAGKTSVLRQLQEDYGSSAHIVALQDLELLDSPPRDPVPQLLELLCDTLAARLKEVGLPDRRLREAKSRKGVIQFKGAMSSTLSAIQPHGARITVLLDEIEHLVPSGIDIIETDLPSIPQFLGALRSLVQEHTNFTFILSGLTSSLTELGRLYGRPNPIFSWAKSYHLSPLDQVEANQMATSIGGRMGVRIEAGALDLIYEASGGHAFLYRHLASHCISTLPKDSFERELSARTVRSNIDSWRMQIAGNVKEMLDHVSRYYPTEAILLDLLEADAANFASVAYDHPLEVGHLRSLGLVQVDGSTYTRSTLLELL